MRRVVQRHLPQIRRWALVATGDVGVAEDVVQEALIRLLRFVHRYDPQRPFEPWLKTLVLNAARGELARRARNPVVAEPEPERAAPEASLDRQLDLARAATRALDAFGYLSPRQREIVDLVDLQGLSPAEAAQQLQITPGAVRGQLFQARRALRARLAEGADPVALLREA